MNEIRKQEHTVDTVTAEIQLIQAQVKKVFYDAVIQIGTRLLEVKELVPHGEWTNYLENRLGYKPSTAQNYMRIAKEFGDGQVALDGTDPQTLFGALGYSQLLPLLSLPDEERRELAQENDLEAMSSREIEELVKARKDAEEKTAQVESELAQVKAAEKAAKESQKAAQKREENALAEKRQAEMRADKLAEEHKLLQNQVKALTEQAEQTPITAEVVPSEAELAQARQEVREEMEEALKQAEEKARQAEARLEKAKNPAAMRVNLLFEDIQAQMDKLQSALAALSAEQPEVADKFRTAIRQYLREGLQ